MAQKRQIFFQNCCDTARAMLKTFSSQASKYEQKKEEREANGKSTALEKLGQDLLDA
jgi:hypothetical protein